MPIDRSSNPEQVYLGEADVAVLAAVVGHPYRLPTIEEIQFVAGAFEEPLIERRVRRLVEQELLEEVGFEDPTNPDQPDTFYGTTEFGDAVVERRLSLDREQALCESYASVEKPPEIRRCERAPRPPR